jgi:hypothetical protein
VIKTLASILFFVAVFSYVSLFIALAWVNDSQALTPTTLTKPIPSTDAFVLSKATFKINK